MQAEPVEALAADDRIADKGFGARRQRQNAKRDFRDVDQPSP
jgi:hypothetical protein